MIAASVTIKLGAQSRHKYTATVRDFMQCYDHFVVEIV
eukprot:SAG11_NODE_197_length_12691_cov_20.904145_11_plen_38_part_00